MAFATTRELRDLRERVEALENLLVDPVEAAYTIPVPVPASVETDTLAPNKEHKEMVALLGERYTALLEDAGYTSLDQLQDTPAGDLTAIVGIGEGVVKRIQNGKK